MIVHNRGWGPQLEDALFASKITGHYRFQHAATAQEAHADPVPESPPSQHRAARAGG
jgi:hypothetical protein